MRVLLSFNVIGAGLIGLVYVISLTTVLNRDAGSVVEVDDQGTRVIQLMHWQLEPGYREAMQQVMDDYNALPHVREANVRVEQLPVTERHFAQVLNVHAISGTAPDLCQRGMSQVLSGNAIARYFDPLGDFVDDPNPYNTQPYLPEDLDADFVDALQQMPWRETFVDGMQGGWDASLQEYYASPTSFLGRLQLYYNADLVPVGKSLLQNAAASDPLPQWYSDLLLRETRDG
ncbi:MAG: hypothetical protein AAF561_00315 [Planctomycetota bacterium]